MRRAYKYRLFTTANQERELAIMLESHRRLYNACQAIRRGAWKTEQRSVGYPASQLCSLCGATVPKTLSERVHRCGCGLVLDRDTNAARNILARALAGTQPREPNVDIGLHVLRSPALKGGE